MKILHTSDWHIGKVVNQFSMIEEQRYILDKIIEVIGEERIDVLLIAGDIYDKPIPPVNALELVEDFLKKVNEMGVKICLISGNHDSAQRVDYGAALMRKENIYINGTYKKSGNSICFFDDFGEVYIHLLPFIKPSMVKEVWQREMESYDQAFHFAIEKLEVDRRKRNILMAHQFILGGSVSDSEELSVGGLDQVSTQGLDIFDYVALGHLHKPQWVGGGCIRYSGTPLPYSFSEENNKNSVTIITLEEKGKMTVDTRILPLRKRFVTLKGSYNELMSREYYKNLSKEDYYRILLTDEEDIASGLAKLRIVYPNIMYMGYENLRTKQQGQVVATTHLEEASPIQIFENLYQMQNNQEMTLQQREYLSQLIEEIWDMGGE